MLVPEARYTADLLLNLPVQVEYGLDEMASQESSRYPGAASSPLRLPSESSSGGENNSRWEKGYQSAPRC